MRQGRVEAGAVQKGVQMVEEASAIAYPNQPFPQTWGGLILGNPIEAAGALPGVRG